MTSPRVLIGWSFGWSRKCKTGEHIIQQLRKWPFWVSVAVPRGWSSHFPDPPWTGLFCLVPPENDVGLSLVLRENLQQTKNWGYIYALFLHLFRRINTLFQYTYKAAFWVIAFNMRIWYLWNMTILFGMLISVTVYISLPIRKNTVW